MGTSVAPAPALILQFLNNAGVPNVGGSLLTQVGSVNYPTFQDAAGTTPLPNPIPLNSRGEISNSSGISSQLFLALGVTYVFTLMDAHGNMIWTAENVQASGGQVGTLTDELGSDGTPGFKAGADFTAGTTETLTLSGFYGSASNLWVAFDAAEQGANSFQLSGHTLTFGSYISGVFTPAPIPVGTNAVFVKGGTTFSLGTPGAGTVTDSSVAAGANINSSKLGFLQKGAGAVNRTVQSKFRDCASLMDFGAMGEGEDNTTAIQDAVTSGARGLYIPLPPVSYMTTAPITVPATSPIRIFGDSITPYQGTGPFPGNRGPGSWFYLNHPGMGFVVGDTTGETFMTGFEMTGIGTYRNHVNPIQAGWTPTVFDYDVQLNNTAFLLDDVCLLNAYKAISVPNNFGTRGTMRNIYGQWFNAGISIAIAEDVIRMYDIHHWPFWANDAPVTSYQLANTVVISLQRVDDPIIDGLFSIFANQVIACFQNASGKVSRLQASNISADQCNFPLFVDPGVTGLTAQFTNFNAFGPATPSASAPGIEINGTNCQVDFVNIQGSFISNSFFTLAGTGNVIRMVNLECDGWGAFSNTAAMLNLFAGGGGNQLRISGKIISTGAEGPFSSIIVSAAAGTIFTNPEGVVSGGALIAAGTTSLVVNHGMPVPPVASQVILSPGSNLGTATITGVTSITATQMTVNISTAQGASVLVNYRVCLE